MDRIAVLIVTSDFAMRDHLSGFLKANNSLRTESCATIRQAMKILENQNIRIVYCDLFVEGKRSAPSIEKIKQMLPQAYVMAGGSTATAKDVISCMQAGADEFLLDPTDPQLIDSAFDKAIREIQQKQRTPEPNARGAMKNIITEDPRLIATLGIAKKVAPSSASILITGESGTGKELLASFIHHNSNRTADPYVAVNCAALPEQLAESELFGHEKGAFTGAVSRKIGKFESAGKGTLVLDEITEMAMTLQAKLLRALQEREIVRLGNNRPVAVEARVVAISNRSMKKAVGEGVFREDLFYRLNVIPLTIPPLRERKDDIPLLADYFLKRFSKQNSKAMTVISDGAMQSLIRHDWPGNVRELENTIQRGVLIGSGNTLQQQDLILEETLSNPSQRPSLSAGVTVREMEKELIFNTLESVNDNRTHAAKMLGISIRTLRNKLNEYREETEMAAP